VDLLYSRRREHNKETVYERDQSYKNEQQQNQKGKEKEKGLSKRLFCPSKFIKLWETLFSLQLAATVGCVWLMISERVGICGLHQSCTPLLTVTQTGRW